MAPALGEDWPAIAAHAAHHDIVNPAEALASWQALSEDRRIAWCASADAVRMLLDAKPAPELAAAMAESRAAKGAVSEMLRMFRPVSGGWSARTSISRLRRIAGQAGTAPPDHDPAHDSEPDEADDLREIITEILDRFEPLNEDGERQMARWRQRAGIENSDGRRLQEPEDRPKAAADATAGAEHLAAELAERKHT